LVPTDDEAEKFMTYKCKVDDPSKYYDIVERIGEGGFAKVLKVRRKKDNAYFALKFISPKSSSEIKMI